MNSNRRGKLTIAMRSLLQYLVLLSVVSCGGGITGTGNGGGTPLPDSDVLEPEIIIDNEPSGGDNSGNGDTNKPEDQTNENQTDEDQTDSGSSVPPDDGNTPEPEKEKPITAIDQRYILRHLPQETMSPLPQSLVSNKTRAADDEPYYQISIQLAKIAKRQLDLGLVQLRMDANWQAIIDYCSTTPEDSHCDFSNANLSTIFTSEMAFREYDLRIEYEMLIQGSDGITEKRRSQILAQAMARIDTAFTVDNGILTIRHNDEYRYELTTTIDHGDGPKHYTLLWSADRSLVKATVTASSDDEMQVVASIHNRSSDDVGNFGTVLLSNGNGENIREFNFNYQQVSHNSAIILESQFSTTNYHERIEILSYGQAGNNGGYLSSTISSGHSPDSRTVFEKREAFGQYDQLQFTDICRSYSDICETYFIQFVTSLADLLNLKEYYTEEQIKKNISSVWVSVSSVDTRPDAFILLDPDKVDMQKLRENPRTNIFEAILGNDGPLGRLFGRHRDRDDASAYGVTHGGLGLSTSVGYNGAVLCRLNRPVGDADAPYRSFCASDKHKISKAVVIAETYIDNKLVTEYQMNADITVSNKFR